MLLRGLCLIRVKDNLLRLIENRTGEKIDDYKEFITVSEETKKDLAELINCHPSRD